MPGVDYSKVAANPDVAWPQRHKGRPKKPLDPSLVAALHHSFSNEGMTVSVVVKNDQVGRVRSQFKRATEELNMRIERVMEKDKPQEGYTTVYFRARVKNYNRKADDNE